MCENANPELARIESSKETAAIVTTVVASAVTAAVASAVAGTVGGSVAGAVGGGVASGAGGGAAGGASAGAGGGGVLTLVDQVQFMTIVGSVGGSLSDSPLDPQSRWFNE